MQAPAAIAFYDSRAPLTERRAKLDRRLAGIAAEFAVQWDLNRVDSALARLQSGSYEKQAIPYADPISLGVPASPTYQAV
jgi:hypothetical protein